MQQDILSFTGKYAPFSNFHPADVVLSGVHYPTVENAFQAAKTMDPAQRVPFQTCSPSEAKHMGRRVDLRPAWASMRVVIMYQLLVQKFAEGTELRALLDSTKGSYICEGNTWHDNIWGSCTCPRCAGRSGDNLLGRLLMLIRDGE